jgi:amidase
MVSMVRDGSISAGELLEAHLREIEQRNPTIHAFVEVFADRAREEARRKPRGLLGGVPITVKDSFDIAGAPTRAGSRLRSSQPASADSAAVARLRAEGAIVIGKTNTPELLASYETDNFLTGRTNHPLDPERTPGGSSGGEAAAIASFCSPGGLASDGGGSIRVPAHFCGIAGLKPTPGRISVAGHFPPLEDPAGLAVVGPMARNARDLRLLFSVLAGSSGRVPDQPRSIGIWEQFYKVPADPEILAAVRRAGALLGAREFRPEGLERAPNVWAVLFANWLSPVVRKLAEGREAELHWTLREALGPQPSPEQVVANLAERDRLRESLLREMEEVPIIVMPVCGITAFRHREPRGLFKAVMPAVLANVLGLPAITVSMGLSSSGMPIGVQLLGRPFEDELLLEVAIRLEDASRI